MEAVTTPMSSCQIGVSFDLDDALTLPGNLDHQIEASKSLVADMPTVVIARSSKNNVCMVCMEGFQAGVAAKQVPCGHLYHSACISSWLSHSDSCPVCRCNIAGEGKR